MDITKTAQKTTDKLTALHQKVMAEFAQKNKKLVSWMADNHVAMADLRTTSQQLLAAISLAGAVSINKPVDTKLVELIQAMGPAESQNLSQVTAEEHEAVMQKLESVVLMPPGHMEQEDELYLEQQLSDMLGFNVTAELDGHRLNHSIGIMGGEQHLRRFPTDSLAQHDAYLEAGIAPNRGAFGWFTENGELTQQAIQREKYYFAVQTLYLPDWNSNHKELKPWYKFRKMIVINPAERVAVVGVVGDAGPAQWVKKQYGGSPEIIREGKIWSSKSRGRVLLLFVDDPHDEVPLGVVSLESLGQVTGESV